MNKFYFSIFFLSLTLNVTSQNINWLSFEEAIALNKKTPKTILIDIYTNWCGYCKKMDKDTYENRTIVNILNEKYYAVKLNAEQKEILTYKGKEYKYIKNGRRGYHEFAANLLRGKLSYPTTVFMNKDEQLIQQLPGYLDAKQLEPILHYFSNDQYLKYTWEEFQDIFVSAF
jgi:thioredoxin-related protein